MDLIVVSIKWIPFGVPIWAYNEGLSIEQLSGCNVTIKLLPSICHFCEGPEMGMISGQLFVSCKCFVCAPDNERPKNYLWSDYQLQLLF